MKFTYMSDLHQEINGGFSNPQHEIGYGDVLLLAGDITCVRYFAVGRNDAESRSKQRALKTFLQKALESYRLVLWVPGNHEYYGLVFAQAKLIMDLWLNNHGFGNSVKFVEAGNHYVNGVNIVMATLWSDYEKGNPISMEACKNYMNDYNQIFRKDYHNMTYVDWHGMEAHCYVTPEFLLDIHKKQLEAIKFALDKSAPTVVLTHHAPSFQSTHPNFIEHSANGAYCSSLEELILDNPQIKVWVHGHTHYNTDYLIGDCHVVSNQMGYLGYKQQPCFKQSEFIAKGFELP